MGKIYKSARKLHKTAKDKYKDGLKNFYRSINSGEWAVKEQRIDRHKMEKDWTKAGYKLSVLYRIGYKKALSILNQI